MILHPAGCPREAEEKHARSARPCPQPGFGGHRRPPRPRGRARGRPLLARPPPAPPLPRQLRARLRHGRRSPLPAAAAAAAAAPGAVGPACVGGAPLGAAALAGALQVSAAPGPRPPRAAPASLCLRLRGRGKLPLSDLGVVVTGTVFGVFGSPREPWCHARPRAALGLCSGRDWLPGNDCPL